MKKLLKRLAMVAVVLVLLLVGGVVALIWSANSAVRQGVEKGATYALGVDTKLAAVRLGGVFSGEVGLGGLQVANPSGFQTPHFLTLGDADVAVDLSTFSTDVLEVPRFALTDIDLNLERKGGKGNYQVILDNLQKVSGGGGSQPAPPGGQEKKLVVRELVLKNVKVHARLLDAPGGVGAALGSAAAVTVPLDEIRLTDVGRTGSGVGGTGVTVGELTNIIVKAVLAAAAEKGGGLIPTELLGDLQGQLAGKLGDLKNLGMQIGGEAASKAVEQAKDVAGKAADEAAKAAKDAADKAKKSIGDGIGNLLGGGGEKKPEGK